MPLASSSRCSVSWLLEELEEAIQYVDHELFTNRFHVTRYGGCAVLFNKDTFLPDIKVKSIYLHDIRNDLPDKVFEGESGWVIQGVISRASFRRQPPGLPTFTGHINYNYAKKRGIGKKLLLTIRAMMRDEQVDLVAGDFNGPAWRRTTTVNNISIIEEAFADCDLPMPSGPTPLWGPGAVPGTWSDVCGFLKPPDSYERWRVRQHGAFPIHHEALGIRQTDRMASHGLCGAAQWPCSRKTRTTTPPERTLGAVPVQQTKVQSRRGCQRPFIRFLHRTRRPFATNTARLRTASRTNAALLRHATIPVHQGQQHLT